MNRVIIRTEELSKVYNQGGIVALSHINLEVEEGEILCILGPSGSGKTTLLNIIGALDRPTSGKVTVDGIDLSQVRNLDRFRAEKVGFVFQSHNLIPVLTAWENVQLPLYALRLSPRQRRQRALELLKAVGLKDRMYHTPAILSGGERQRIAIARALANSPKLMLCDEPTGTLDPETEAEVIQLVRHLNRERGITFVVVTHSPEIAREAHRIVHLVGGRIMEAGGKESKG